MNNKFGRSVLLLIVIALFSFCVFMACNDTKPTDTIEPPDSGITDTELSIWDCTPEDFGNYLVQKGHIEYNDYLNITTFATASRRYGNIEVFWWDVDNLKEGTKAYETWQEFKENEFYYFTILGTIYVPHVNGPFAIKALDNFGGDEERLYADFAQFPKGYSKDSKTTINDVDYSKDRDVVYENIDKLSLSYPNYSYDYVRNPIDLPSAYCIRDDYVLYTQAQDAQGLCWDFSSSLALSTTLMRTSGEYVDISEAYISAALRHNVIHGTLPNYKNLNPTYLVGDAGGFLAFDLVAQKEGIVLEQDFDIGESYLMGNENAEEFYNYYNRYANKEIMQKVTAVRFDDYSITHESETVKNSMKSHILQRGSITSWTYSKGFKTAEYNGRNITYKDPDENGADHVISFIGWDDNFSLVIDGKTHTGAWIVLNSWDNSAHNDGVFYIFYDDVCFSLGGHMWGYVYRDEVTPQNIYFADKVIDGGEFITDKVGYYYGDFSSTTGMTKQKNIFFRSGVDLTYEYELSEGAKVDEIEIYRDGNNVTKDFSVSHDASKNTFTVLAQNAYSGEYKIEIDYSLEKTRKKYYNSFYVVCGTEIGAVNMVTVESDNPIVNNGKYNLFYRFGDETEILPYYTTKTSGSVMYYVWFNTYNRIAAAEGEHITVDLNPQNSYAYFTVNYDIAVTDTYPIIFTTNDGQQKIITVSVILARENDTLANVWYDTDGGSTENRSKVLLSEDSPAKIDVPEKEGYSFEGWYYDKEFTKALEFDGEKYLLDYSELVIKNYLTSYFSVTFKDYYGKYVGVRLYAKWSRNE